MVWLMLPKHLLVVIGALLLAAAPRVHGQPTLDKNTIYEFDPDWEPQFPDGCNMYSGVALSASGSQLYVTQRGNATIDPVQVVDVATGAFLRSWGKSSVAVDYSKNPPTWGAHGIAVEVMPAVAPLAERVWIDDFTNHTLTAHTPNGRVLLEFGTPGVAGNSTKPLQFGSLADTVITPGSATSPAAVYTSDGDGGSANRVVKLLVPIESSSTSTLGWATPAQFNNPHGLTLHQRTGLVIVADRENERLRLLSSDTGHDLGTLSTPGLSLGDALGKPFSVRTFANRGRDLLMVAVMDNPQDGKNQKIVVLDCDSLAWSGDQKTTPTGGCASVQVLPIPSSFSGPHLLAVSSSDGTLFAALVAGSPRSWVLRFNMLW